jgi:hypothetical protein
MLRRGLDVKNSIASHRLERVCCPTSAIQATRHELNQPTHDGSERSNDGEDSCLFDQCSRGHKWEHASQHLTELIPREGELGL